VATTINLGKDYTISGTLENVSDLTITKSGEKIDVTTRFGSKPIKFTTAGLPKITLDCTVIATDTTTFSLGGSIAVTSSGFTGTVIIVSADRSEPHDGMVTYKLQLTPGSAMETPLSV
jgi:hypothetical protein